MLLFMEQLITILVLIGIVFVIIWEMFHGRISLNLVPLLLLINFVSGSRLESMFSSLIVISGQPSFIFIVFSCLCFFIPQRNHFFCLYQKINLLHLKWSSDKILIVAKDFLKLATLLILMKQKILSLPRNLALVTLGELLIVFSSKVILL